LAELCIEDCSFLVIYTVRLWNVVADHLNNLKGLISYDLQG
jgi:hypothetical protein